MVIVSDGVIAGIIVPIIALSYSIPLFLRTAILYTRKTSEAATTYGKLGVKVWICRGEILPEKKSAKAEEKGE